MLLDHNDATVIVALNCYANAKSALDCLFENVSSIRIRVATLVLDLNAAAYFQVWLYFRSIA